MLKRLIILALALRKMIEPGRLGIVPRRRHVAVEDGGAVVEVGPREVLVGSRCCHRG